MLLGIPYHAITLGNDWTALPSQDSSSLMLVADVIHSFRMPVFFMIAGYFSCMLLARKEPVKWLNGRMIRLGIPFMACAILLSPLQMLIDQYGQNGFSASSSTIMAGWISQLASPGSHWIRHLWFLPALLWLSALLAICHIILPNLKSVRLPAHVNKFIQQWPWATMLVLIFLTTTAAVLGRGVVYLSGAAAHPVVQMVNLQGAAANLPFFIVGALLSRSKGLLNIFTDTKPAFIIAAITVSIISTRFGLDGGPLDTMLGIGLVSAASLFWAHTTFSIAHQFFNKENKLVRKFVDASFVIYLFHQPVLLFIKLILIKYMENPIGIFFITTSVTIVTSYSIYRIVISSKASNFIFNGAIGNIK